MQPTNEQLLKRLHKELSKNIAPFLVLSVLSKLEYASSEELQAEISKQTAGIYEVNAPSMKYLLGHMEKTFGLLDKVKDTYELSEKGEEILKEAKPLLSPLKKFI